MRARLRFGVLVAGLTAAALLGQGSGRVVAAPITYTEQAIGSGTFGGMTFTNALVTVTFTGDTTNVTGGPLFLNTVGTETVTVAGIGTATVTEPFLEAFDNQATSGAGIGAGTSSSFAPDILDTFNPAFATYDLKSFIGPVSGIPAFNPSITFNTSLGAFNLQSVAGDSTFTAASPVPEPSSLALLGLGTLGLAGWRLSSSPTSGHGKSEK
jgi:hypothetical protein